MVDEMQAVIMLLMLGAPATLYLLSPRKVFQIQMSTLQCIEYNMQNCFVD